MRAATASNVDALFAYEKLLDLAEKRRNLSDNRETAYWDWKTAVAHENIGDIHRLRGDVSKALSHYAEFENTMDRVVSLDPYNILWERSGALSHERVGDMHRALAEAAGDLAQVSKTDEFIRAEEEYQYFLNTVEATQVRDTKNADLHRLKAQAFERKGDLLAFQAFEGREAPFLFGRKVAEARQQYEREQEIVSRLLKEQPNNGDFERDLLIVNEKLGDLLIVEGKFAEARKVYQDIEKKLVSPDPNDLDRVRDAQLIHERIADAYWQEGNQADAMREFDICAKMKSEVLFDPRTGLLYDQGGDSAVRKRFGERSDVRAYCVKGFSQIASLERRAVPADTCTGRADGPRRCR